MSAELPALTPIPVDELIERIADRVAERLAAQPPRPALIDRQTFGRLIDVSQPTVSRLIDEGMPCVKMGAVVRIEPDRALAWLRDRKAP